MGEGGHRPSMPLGGGGGGSAAADKEGGEAMENKNGATPSEGEREGGGGGRGGASAASTEGVVPSLESPWDGRVGGAEDGESRWRGGWVSVTEAEETSWGVQKEAADGGGGRYPVRRMGKDDVVVSRAGALATERVGGTIGSAVVGIGGGDG